jgi:glycosyltransferase involved in cell wall biosynthesis
MGGPHLKNNSDMNPNCAPTLTIIIPTFNSIEHLPICMDSIRHVLGRSLGNEVCVLIQDGGSTDGTMAFAQSLNTNGIRVISEQDRGVYDAMNKATKNTDTDWVYFLGSDDRLLPDFSAMPGQLIDTGRIYYANVRYASSGKRYDGPFSLFKLAFRNICHQSMFFPRQILEKEQYSLDYPIKSDWAHNIRLFAKLPFQHVDLDVALYNDSGGLSSTYEDVQFEKDKAKLFHESHGYWLKLLCFLVPTATRVFHLAIRRNKKKPVEFGSTSKRYIRK